VRSKVLDLLDTVPFEGRRLVEQGFAFGMIVQHEQQHAETMLATHQLREGAAVLHSPAPPEPVTPVRGEVFVPGGPFVMGTSSDPWALDNERPAHQVDVPPFVIDARRSPTRVPGLHRRRRLRRQPLVDADGWATGSRRTWSRRSTGAATATAGLHRFGVTEPIVPDEPVVHVCFHEAAPTPLGGQAAADRGRVGEGGPFDPATGGPGASRGATTTGRRSARTSGSGTCPGAGRGLPAGASPLGVHQLIGDVWEWVDTTSTATRASPPSRTGSTRRSSSARSTGCCGGGSFGTDVAACRGTFRNWDYPIRRQIFSGFRCARDPEPGEVL
jgi:iron(II)-dependent oxidoreductase